MAQEAYKVSVEYNSFFSFTEDDVSGGMKDSVEMVSWWKEGKKEDWGLGGLRRVVPGLWKEYKMSY